MSVDTPNPQDGARPARKMDFLLLALLLASLALNVYLGLYAARLKNAPPAQTASGELAAGTAVEPITVSGLDGKQEVLSFDDGSRPTVLYVMTPECKWCGRNVENVKALAGSGGNSFRFVALSLGGEGLKEYVDGNHFTFPVYKNPSADSVRALGLGSTPQTIVISADGRVLKSWVGAYGERLRPEVEAYFGVRLPGLTAGDNLAAGTKPADERLK